MGLESRSLSEKVTRILQFLHNHHVEPLPDTPFEVNLKDDDDRWVLESAIRAKADILVTGDKDLLELSGQVPKPRIVTPRKFWKLVQE